MARLLRIEFPAAVYRCEQGGKELSKVISIMLDCKA
jgi:hypothetical protein